MTALEVLDEDNDHFLLTFDRPGRVEILLTHGRVVAHVYDGDQIDPNQHVLFAYDGLEGDNENLSR